ncbi:hypothetical protein N5079_08110 [Planotetraspora sp. A-T 1434]|uniref:hypothetical protein n=1 Tax=Planotetraspora sp. A-T 1434 TaxID=2979219 RepID=UPI0021C1F8AF|nr:hypothetical protein [Planotetraspora sp. A-T 1434]MCT9930188.1 hypothetical protein [Planotetraspora sp. A-T 1434]
MLDMPRFRWSADEKGAVMAAQHYCADTDDGYHLDDPSPEALVVLISELNHTDNTFMAVQPDGDDPPWSVSVSLREDDTYEIERREGPGQEPHQTTHTNGGATAEELLSWLAARTHA